MGITIKASAINSDKTIKSSVLKAGAAAQECIKNAGIDPQEIDILINIGVYRDDNMVEPSMAAMIQKEAGINLDNVKFPVERVAFSFDLINGPCGFLNSVQVSEGFLRSKKAINTLVVSSNAHPSNKDVPGFDFKNIGAAMILSLSDDETKGFQNYSFETSGKGYVGLRSYVDLSANTRDGRDRVTVEQDEQYEEKLLEFTAQLAKKYISDNNINRVTTKLITSQVSGDFSKKLAEILGFPAEAADNLFDTYGDSHTSSLILGYNYAIDKGTLKKYDSILFINSGSGLSTGCALYRL